MRPDSFKRSPTFNHAVFSHNVMIAAARPAVGNMPSMNCLSINVAVDVADVMNNNSPSVITPLERLNKIQMRFTNRDEFLSLKNNFGNNNQQLYDQLEDLNPDFILIGGIFKNMDANLEEAATILDTPKAKIMVAVTAIGAPKPASASSSPPKQNAIIIAWMRMSPPPTWSKNLRRSSERPDTTVTS